MNKICSEEKMKPLIIAHAEDPDGIIARALLMRQFPSEQEHVFVRYDKIIEAFEQSFTKSANLVYVADINPNPRLVQAGSAEFSLLEELAKEREVYWFDHHDATLRHKERLSDLGIKIYHQETQCAAMIINQHYRRSDPYEIALAKIAQAHDYKKTSGDHKNILLGDYLEKIISLANENLNYDLLLDLSYSLQEEKFFSGSWKLRPEWQSFVDQFTFREQAAYADLDDSVEIIKASKHTFLFGHSSPLLSQKLAPFYLRKNYGTKAEVFVCLFKHPVRNHIVFTNAASTFPVVPFVQSLGGGGRGNEGGFTLDYDITPANFQQVKDMLTQKIEEYAGSQ